MKISGSTKISELIKVNIASIDAIAAINKHFEKLKNPLLRKLLASRVTIADAAKIGGCSVNTFFVALAPLGFESEQVNNSSNTEVPKPSFASTITKENTTVLDVRADLANGLDPFKKIIKAISLMPPNNVLKLINSFEPSPLINILQQKGFEYYVEHPKKEEVHVYFKNTKGVNATEITELEKNKPEGASSIEEEKKRFGGNIREIDVRQMEMPLPMITILSELEKLPIDFALFVHHKKIPQFLLPDLMGQGYTYLIDEIREGEVNMLIYR